MSETLLIVLGAIGLLAVGGALGFWLAQFRMRGDAARADEVREQFDDYRREVTQHFGRTADHFKAIGREYRELYEHMASGADSLCERDAVDVKLSFAPKAILESIAEEQQAQPQVPMDFEQTEQAVEPPLNPPEEPISAGPEEESVETLKADKEAEAGDEASRTLH
jgi:uncharacterized membrane-anchored protein YhcB (DUF1043 family)